MSARIWSARALAFRFGTMRGLVLGVAEGKASAEQGVFQQVDAADPNPPVVDLRALTA